MTTSSERKMAADILRTLADEMEAMPDNPFKHEVKSLLYDIFVVQTIVNNWGD